MSHFDKKKIIYVYDALCPWCYAFTPIVQRLRTHYDDLFEFEVLSGGMVRDEYVRFVSGPEEAARLRTSYRQIEQEANVQFGESFFDAVATNGRYLNSEPPAVALAAFRTLDTGISEVDFAHGLLRGVFWHGGDPNEDKFYRHIAEELGFDPEALLTAMHQEEAKNLAVYDFVLARQLGVDAFPRLFFQTAIDYLHLISKGYSSFERIQRIIDTMEPTPNS